MLIKGLYLISGINKVQIETVWNIGEVHVE